MTSPFCCVRRHSTRIFSWRAKAIAFPIVCLIVCAAGARTGAAEEPTVVLAGKAVALDGSPIVQAHVSFTVPAQTYALTSDASGEFRAEVPLASAGLATINVEPLPDRRLAPCFILWPHGPGTTPGPDFGRVMIFFAPATASFTGTVVGAGDQPIAGAKVTLQGGGWRERFSRSAITQADGKFQIDNLAPGNYRVHSVEPPQGQPFIRLENYKPMGVEQFRVADGQTVDRKYSLTRSARLTGRILAGDGRPLAGAAISCSLDSATETGKAAMYQKPGEWYSASTTTDADGRYALVGLTPETYRIDIKPEGFEYAPSALRGVTVPSAPAGDVTVQDVTLAKGAKLVAIIVGEEGKPLAGAKVTLDPGLDASLPALVSDAHGRVTLAGLATGKYSLRVEPPDGTSLPARTFTDLAAVGGLSVEHTLSMTAGASVSGTVSDAQGKPLAGAIVSILDNYVPAGKAISDQAGHFTLIGIVRAAPDQDRASAWQVSVSPPDSAAELMEAMVKVADPTAAAIAPVNVRLNRGAVITGVVTDSAGKPVPNCNVTCGTIGRNNVETLGNAMTDRQGKYVLGHIRPGNWSVAVLPPADTGLRGQISSPAQAPADKESTVNFTLKAGQTITGRIVVPGGRPVPVSLLSVLPGNNQVLWFMRENERFDAISSPDGTFRITGLPPGNLKLKCAPVLADGAGQPVEVTVTQGTPAVINLSLPSK